ncbi:MAG: hypothetical protein SGCHY_004440 [Lobulomycetales sp.]
MQQAFEDGLRSLPDASSLRSRVLDGLEEHLFCLDALAPEPGLVMDALALVEKVSLIRCVDNPRLELFRVDSFSILPVQRFCSSCYTHSVERTGALCCHVLAVLLAQSLKLNPDVRTVSQSQFHEIFSSL